MTFKPIENRDAWATIRGFVYQVQLTIIQWLELTDSQVLELEKGEDIDLVTQGIDNQELERQLNQVKFKEAGISLGQKDILEIILNYFTHKRDNPDKKLRFRYISNTECVKERPALFVDGKKGIDAWIELNKSNIEPTNPIFISIKEHLINKAAFVIEDIQRDDSDGNNQLLRDWQEFKNFIENDFNLKELIAGFNWSLGTGDTIKLKNKIDGWIAVNTTSNNSESIYPRLFLHVFETLCKRGKKYLSKKDLEQIIQLPELNADQVKWYASIEGILDIVAEKIDSIDRQVKINSNKLDDIISKQSGGETPQLAFSYQLKALTINAPAIVKHGSKREKKVSHIIGCLTNKVWVSIQGINGSGKTQLAALISLSHNNSYWLDLRPFLKELDKIHLIFGAFVSRISGVGFIPDLSVWFEKVVNELPENTLIVLNDIPDAGMNDHYDKLMTQFINAANNSTIRFITTSNHQIRDSIKERINVENFLEYSDLTFDDEELKEYLNNSGAPSEVVGFSSLISSVTQDNPRLISAVIQALKDINWGKDSVEVFETLFEKKFSNRILEDTQKSIKALIKDTESKELLYRLSLINWSLSEEEIFAAASVPLEIKYPREKLIDLENIWIQKISNSRYQISPLIDQIGKKNLSLTVVNNVYLKVAGSIMQSGKIDQIKAFRVITLYMNAGQINQAGLVLTRLYQSVHTFQEAEILYEWGYLHYWTSTSFPESLDLLLRAQVLQEQIRIRVLLGKDSSNSYSKLESILDHPNISKAEEFIVRIYCLVSQHTSISRTASFHLKKILNSYDEIGKPFSEFITEEFISGILWHMMNGLSNYHELREWIDLIEAGEKDLNFDFFADEMAQTAITVLSSRIVNSENFTYDADQTNEDILYELKKYFQDRNQQELEATIVKEIVALDFSKGEKGIEKAIDLTEKSLLKFDSVIAQYLMHENLGKLFKNTNSEKARQSLEKALEYNCTAQSSYIDTLIYYASIISNENSEKALECCIKAKEFALGRENLDELSLLHISAELGIAYWLNGNNPKSYEVFEEVILGLFDCKSNNDKKWIGLLKRVGHGLGYITADVRVVPVPQTVKDGSEWVKPYQGYLMLNTNDLSDLYNEEEEPVLHVYMAYFAEGIDNLEKAYTWSLRAFDHSRKLYNPRIYFMIQSICSQFLILNYKVAEVLDSHLFFAAITSHLSGTTAQEKHEELSEVNIPNILSDKPSEKWNIAEETTISFAMTPLFIMALTSQYEGQNKRIEEFLTTIKEYIPSASKTEIWQLLLELSSRIFEGVISRKELTDRANTFSESDNERFYIICSLGLIHTTNDYSLMLGQLINILPYLVKISSITEGIVRFVLFPFVNNRVKLIIKESYVGSRSEIEELMRKVDAVDPKDSNCIQKLLQPAVSVLELKIPADREKWLNEYADIVKNKK